MEGTQSLARAEQAGIRVDMDYIQKKKRQLTNRIESMEEEFRETKFYRRWAHSVKGNINIHANQQLSHYLYDILKLDPAKRTKKSDQGSTDEEALKQLQIPEVNALLEIRKLKKVRDTYLEGFAREQVDGYIHPFFNLHLVRTFRSSSDHPNFQNIPKRDEEAMQICRQALFARPGHQLLEVDFSGLEVRIAAAYHKDPTMLAYLWDPSSDMHGDMAKQIFLIDKYDKTIPAHYTMRQAAKNGFVFPQFYGDYFKNNAEGICEWMKLPQTKWKAGQGIPLLDGTVSDHLIAKGIKEFGSMRRGEHGKPIVTGFLKHIKNIETDFWENRFPVYAKWKEQWWNQYLAKGYIDMYTGFRCSGMMGKNDCINYPVQGAAFHCLLYLLNRLDGIIIEEELDSRIIGQIHDSIIIDTHPEELNYIAHLAHEIVVEELPKVWDWINVPLDIDAELAPIDHPWSEKCKYVLN
jgi:DNA polymerase I-like protein with 3'-5' exonuclease and polymerase domains